MASRQWGGYLNVLLGHDDGTSAFSEAYGTHGNSIHSPVLADFNGDGYLDVAAARYESNAVSLFFGHGDGTLQEAGVFATGVGPNSLAAADFNGDGKLDLAWANSFSNSVSMLLGNGNGTFQTARSFAAGNAPQSINPIHVNGDGALDGVVADPLSTSSPGAVSVLQGNSDGGLAAPISTITGPAGSSPTSVSHFSGAPT